MSESTLVLINFILHNAILKYLQKQANGEIKKNTRSNLLLFVRNMLLFDT